MTKKFNKMIITYSTVISLVQIAFLSIPLLLTIYLLYFPLLEESLINTVSNNSSANIEYIYAETENILYKVANNTNFLFNLTSGEKIIYERKAIWGILQWGDETIPINGYVKNVTNKQPLENQIVQIQAFQDETLIFEKFLKVDGDGYYETSFYPPSDGTVTVKAILVSQNPPVENLITVIATQAWMPAILITFFISLLISLAVGFWMLYKAKWKNKDEFWLKAGLIPIVPVNVVTYMILYKFPPFDAAGNAAIAAALIAPMAVYIFETLKKTT